MFFRLTEVVCDYEDCQADHAIHVGRLEDARKKYGFVFTRDGKHFCCRECYKAYKKQSKNAH